MAEGHDHEYLSFGDALFLHLEREGMPLHVASLGIFEGSISLAAAIEFVASKLPLLPRYFQRVVLPPLGIGIPAWQQDPTFDIRNHVREIKLKRGTGKELRSAVSRFLSVALPRERPLWDLIIFSGLQGNRTAMITRVHHCLADGISGVGLLKVMMDPSPQPVPVPKARQHAPTPSTMHDPATLLLDGIVTTCFSAVERILTAESELLEFAHRLAANGNPSEPPLPPADAHANGLAAEPVNPSIADLNRLLPDLFAPADRLPFNLVCRGPQKYDWTEIPLPELKRVKHLCGVTVNDVVLTLMTSAIRQYSLVHGCRLRGKTLRVVVPVSVRGKVKDTELGNRISFVPVNIPLDIRSPRRLLMAVHQRMMALKNAHVAELVGLAGTLLGTIPTAVQAVIGPIASQLPISVCNTICTNVPGPKTPLYFMGHRMLSCYPYVPIGGEMGMNCSVLTYEGAAHFGLTGDVHAIPDLDLLPRFLQAGFAELKRSLHMPAPRAARARAQQAVPAPEPEPASAQEKRNQSPADAEAQPEPALAAAAD